MGGYSTSKNQKHLILRHSLGYSAEQEIYSLFQRLLLKKTCSLSAARSVLGRLNFPNYVIPQGQIHCRHIQSRLRGTQRIMFTLNNMLPKDVQLNLQLQMKRHTQYSKYASGGPLYFSASSRSSPLRDSGPIQRGRSIPQGVQQVMGILNSLDFSSSVSYTSCFDSLKQLQRLVHHSSPQLDKIILETRPTEPSRRPVYNLQKT